MQGRANNPSLAFAQQTAFDSGQAQSFGHKQNGEDDAKKTQESRTNL